MSIAEDTASYTKVFSGDRGIKTICKGDKVIYTRPGGYLYITLDTQSETNTKG